MRTQSLRLSKRLPQVGDVLFTEHVSAESGEVRRKEFKVDSPLRVKGELVGFLLVRTDGLEASPYLLEDLNRRFAYVSRADGGEVAA